MDDEINEILRRGKNLQEEPLEAPVQMLESASQSKRGNSSVGGKSGF
jgi:hypothetical protein